MTEEDYQAHSLEFAKKLKHLPQVGKRPFGYPKGYWWLSGFFGMAGIVAGLPLVVSKEVNYITVISAIGGAVLFCCMFAMRMTAYFWALNRSVDHHIFERLAELESQTES